MARFALTAADGTIANIIELDPLSEQGKPYADAVALSTYQLVPLADGADAMGGIVVEPGDKCTAPKAAKPTFQKGTLGATVVKIDPVPVEADPAIDPEPIAKP